MPRDSGTNGGYNGRRALFSLKIVSGGFMCARELPLNLVMVTLDCVRPDHLGCYGCRHVETPNLDALASHGVLFEQALTHAPNTWVSHATIFTGLLPPRHGLRAASNRISPDAVTLAEWLSGLGYATAGFPGTTLVGRPMGFHRGFHLFHEAWWDNGWRVQENVWRRNWEEALGLAFDWMRRARQPFFVWLHYMDTHHLPEIRLPDYFRRHFSPRWQNYDGKISYADQVCTGPLLEFLKSHGLLERTALTVFSDHGEELHDDDRPLHDLGLGEDVIRVPLVFHLPGTVLGAPRRVPDQVRLLDLFPTLCDLLGIPCPQDLDGASLVPLFHGRPVEGADFSLAYLENWPKGLLGLRTPEWKLILRYPRPKERDTAELLVEGLYHLPTDPSERVDVSGAHPVVVEHLRANCLRLSRGRPEELLITDEEAELVDRALRALGYLD